MKIIHSAAEMQEIARQLKIQSKIIGFVPTMGYLHKGHLSLMSRSVKDCDVTVVSIYVNPMQFGPKEDFKKYPRDIKTDLKLCRQQNVDYVFIPKDAQIYPKGYMTEVQVKGITDSLCGKFRPGHFTGVCTIVSKLFNIVKADIAYFGQKDAQQALVIKKMVKDLHMSLKIKVLPIIREPDGLAMSSRNAYLDDKQRQDAVLLSQALKKAKQLIEQKQRKTAKIIFQMKRLLSQSEFATIEYIAIVDADHLSEIKQLKAKTKVLIVLAVYMGRVRLIDNILVKVD
ncbi:MAG: pantoate--beta-alanine ligase [Candidatus Omnitrophica bacterium]|nr:pantoate--beta-alanine ligase [Candidatus Omnitrophota bacterium]